MDDLLFCPICNAPTDSDHEDWCDDYGGYGACHGVFNPNLAVCQYCPDADNCPDDVAQIL